MTMEDEDSLTAVHRNNGNRIQKLLFTEYKDFEDMVLIECPFAQTTREGQGIRQIQMGLTPTKLIMAGDVLCRGRDGNCSCSSCLWPDEDEDGFELISICPVEWVNVSVFRRHSRNTLKARFCNNRVLYFELAASHNRQMFWNLWCERVKFLCPEEPKSTQSETSVGSSTSESVQPRKVPAKRPGILLKTKGKSSKSKSNGEFRWKDRNLFLGRNFERNAASEYPAIELDPSPAPSPLLNQFTSADNRDRDSGNWTDPSGSRSGLHQVNRFGQGINENCSTGLCLPPPDPRSNIAPSTIQSDSIENYQVVQIETIKTRFDLLAKGWCERETWVAALIEDGVSLWEQRHQPPDGEWCSSKPSDIPNQTEQTRNVLGGGKRAEEDWSRHARRRRLKRRYGLQPLPHFMYGVGPWKLSRSQSHSLQLKRVSSEVYPRPRLGERDGAEFRLGVGKRQLNARLSSCRLPLCWETLPDAAGQSHADTLTRRTTDLEDAEKSERGVAKMSHSNRYFVHQKPPVHFWTPNNWYRPMSEWQAYHQVRSHMESLRQYLDRTFRISSSPRGGHTKRRIHLPWKLARKKKNAPSEAGSKCVEGGTAGGYHTSSTNKASHNGSNDFTHSRKVDIKMTDKSHKAHTITSSQIFETKSDQLLTTWDFNSTVIAYQLTLIDRDLFKKLTEDDLMAVLLEGNAKNSPNLSAMIAFSHRTANLVSSQILSIDSIKMRARMIARYINVADKLHRLHNLQSASSVLFGLQMPSVFRLDRTWRYIRARHSTKYERLLTLLRMYREPRSLEYERMVERSCRTEPYLPPTPYILAALLAKLPHPTSLLPFPDIASGKSNCSGVCTLHKGASSLAMVPKSLIRCISPFMISSLISCDSVNSEQTNNSCRSETSGDSGSYPISKLSRYFEAVREDELEPGRRVGLLWGSVAAWQRAADKYALPGSKQAHQFFTVTPYREEMDNFFLSLELEPQEESWYESKKQHVHEDPPLKIEDSHSNEGV